MLDIPDVKLDAVVPRQLCTAVDLGPARQPGLHVQPPPLPWRVLLHLVTQGRPWSDHAHFPAQDVPELRKLVERKAAQRAPHPRDPRIAAVDRVPGAEPLGADDHRAQLEELEVDAVLADARLPVENGPGALELDRERGNGQERAREDEPAAGDRKVQRPVQRGPPRGGASSSVAASKKTRTAASKPIEVVVLVAEVLRSHCTPSGSFRIM